MPKQMAAHRAASGGLALIAMGLAGAFAGVAVAIDRGVEDSTPSSLGQR